MIRATYLMLLLATATLIAACGRAEDSKLINPVTEKSVDQEGPGLQMDPALAERDHAVCLNWNYDKQFLSSDLAAMRPATIEEWGRKCYQYACSTVLPVVENGVEQLFEVNAGGWIMIRSKENRDVKIYISERKQERFLAACNCCEEE